MKPFIPTCPIPALADYSMPAGNPHIVLTATVILAILDVCRLVVIWQIARARKTPKSKPRPHTPAE